MRISDLLSEETLVSALEGEKIQIHNIQGMYIVKIEDVPLSADDHIFQSLDDAMNYACSI